jgi:hypothetical protein
MGILFCVVAALVLITGCTPPAPPVYIQPQWAPGSAWTTNHGPRSTAEMKRVVKDDRNAYRIDYTMPADAHGYVEFIRDVADGLDVEDHPFAFDIKAEGTGNLEVKFIDSDGSVFRRVFPLKDAFEDWTHIVMDLSSVDYGWGGQNSTFEHFKTLMMVPAGQGGKGTLWLSDIGFASESIPPTVPPVGPLLDPYRELSGIGDRQRRHAELIPENPLVLEWMKHVQDTTTPAKNLLGSLEDQSIHTFNNALAATAFLVKGERERAERILDFFASAVNRENTEQFKQNFFYNGEARGFFQNAYPVEKDGEVLFYGTDNSDRWMGDMAWLMFAYLYHDKLYGTDRYAEIEKLITDLLLEWYIDAPDGRGGYVQHGWRKGDIRLHENHGHPEGNIDCYALFRVLGMDAHAQKIRTWLDHRLDAPGLPLDLYSWRVLAYAPEKAELLDYPDYDLRYRKTVTFNGKDIIGVYHSANETVSNIWVDGVGHMACAYFAVGNEQRGNFYANQMDRMLVDRPLGGRTLKGVPYVLNHQGGFEAFDVTVGSVSPAAWYIFAKNRFNPMLLESAD